MVSSCQSWLGQISTGYIRLDRLLQDRTCYFSVGQVRSVKNWLVQVRSVYVRLGQAK
jgi:hypothetical protein